MLKIKQELRKIFRGIWVCARHYVWVLHDCDC